MSCLRRILGLRWFDFVPNVIGDEPDSTAQHLQQHQWPYLDMYVACNLESVPAHEALRPAVKTHSGHRPDDRPEWNRPRGRPRQTWIRPLETDVGYTADAGWDMASDRQLWRAQRPVAGQAVQWVSEWVNPTEVILPRNTHGFLQNSRWRLCGGLHSLNGFYTVSQKKEATKLWAVTLSNLNRF